MKPVPESQQRHGPGRPSGGSGRARGWAALSAGLVLALGASLTHAPAAAQDSRPAASPTTTPAPAPAPAAKIAPALEAAAKEGLIVANSYYKDAESGVFWAPSIVATEKRWVVETKHYDPKARTIARRFALLDARGAPLAFALSDAKYGAEPHAKRAWEVKADKLVAKEPKDGPTGLVPADAVPLELAYFVLPTLAASGALELPLTFRLLSDGLSKAQPAFTLKEVKEETQRARTFAFSDGTRSARVSVKTKNGKVLMIETLEGKLVTLASREAFAKATR